MLYNNRCDNNIILGILVIDVSNILCTLEILYVEYIIQMELSYHIGTSNVKKYLKHLDVINILNIYVNKPHTILCFYLNFTLKHGT